MAPTESERFGQGQLMSRLRSSITSNGSSGVVVVAVPVIARHSPSGSSSTRYLPFQVVVRMTVAVVASRYVWATSKDG